MVLCDIENLETVKAFRFAFEKRLLENRSAKSRSTKLIFFEFLIHFSFTLDISNFALHHFWLLWKWDSWHRLDSLAIILFYIAVLARNLSIWTGENSFTETPYLALSSAWRQISTAKAHLQTKHHWRNSNKLVKEVPQRKCAYRAHWLILYIYIFNCCSISSDPKCSIGRAYIQTVMEERITLCKYTTQSFMFYTFVRNTFLFYLKKQGQNCYWI